MLYKVNLLSIVLIIAMASSILLLSEPRVINGANAAPWQYRAVLTGRDEDPPITTSAAGLADFRISDNETMLRYRVNLTGITNVTGGNIHLGKIGQNGDIVVDLFQIGFSKHKKTNYGMIVRGNITESILKGSMKGKTVAGLVSLMDTGGVYVNINTRYHAKGEIRGQIELLNQSKSNMTGVSFSTLTE